MNMIMYIAMSLDGYIADKYGGIDWLEKYNKIDYGYFDFIKNIDCIIMGSKTYEQILGFDGEWPYPDTKSYILSEKHYQDKNIEATCSNIEILQKELKIKGFKNIWVMGGAETCQSFLNKDLINKIDLFITPDILGDGIKLFNNVSENIKLPVKSTKVFDKKIVGITYEK